MVISGSRALSPYKDIWKTENRWSEVKSKIDSEIQNCHLSQVSLQSLRIWSLFYEISETLDKMTRETNGSFIGLYQLVQKLGVLGENESVITFSKTFGE